MGFIFLNYQLGTAILKLHGCFLDTVIVKNKTAEILFGNSFMKYLECLSRRGNSIIGGILDQVGVRMREDEN